MFKQDVPLQGHLGADTRQVDQKLKYEKVNHSK